MKTYFESTRKKLRFQNRKTYSRNTLWTAGVILRNLKDSFAKRPQRKGIGKPRPLDLKRRAQITRMEGEGEAAAGTEGPPRWSSMGNGESSLA